MIYLINDGSMVDYYYVACVVGYVDAYMVHQLCNSSLLFFHGRGDNRWQMSIFRVLTLIICVS